MAKSERLLLGSGMFVEALRDFNGRYWVALARGASVIVRDPSALRRFLKLPKGTTSREVLDEWLAAQRAADAEKAARRESASSAPALSEELLATGFGPECHAET